MPAQRPSSGRGDGIGGSVSSLHQCGCRIDARNKKAPARAYGGGVARRRHLQKASGVPGDAERKFDLWLQTATRYFVLTDAGAAVAVPSFIGNSNTVSKLAVASLLCFVLGLTVAGLVTLGQITGAYRAYLTKMGDPIAADHSIKGSWLTRWSDRVEPRTGSFLAAAFALFVLGSIVGPYVNSI